MKQNKRSRTKEGSDTRWRYNAHAKETGEARMRACYNGGAFDPTMSGDDLSMRIVRHAAGDIRYQSITEGESQREVSLRID